MTMTDNVIAFRSRPANQSLRRPRALIQAARAGQSGWRRDRDLARLLNSDGCPAPGAALRRLRAEEGLLDDARRAGAADYDMRRHVLLMIAILAEMRAAVDAAPLTVALPKLSLPAMVAAITPGIATGIAAGIATART